jgi:prepilin-type N-terminal cleavage/methylation domain-containing protein
MGSIPAQPVGPTECRAVARRRLKAFTLVEIMVVVVIIGLLAAIAIAAFQRVRERSTASRFANDFRQYEAAFQRFALESGTWPAAGGLGTIPTGMTGYLPGSFTNTSAMGGNYQWSGPSRNIVLRNSQVTDAIMVRVDALLDDGVLATGQFTKIAGVGYGYHVQ